MSHGRWAVALQRRGACPVHPSAVVRRASTSLAVTHTASVRRQRRADAAQEALHKRAEAGQDQLRVPLRLLTYYAPRRRTPPPRPPLSQECPHHGPRCPSAAAGAARWLRRGKTTREGVCCLQKRRLRAPEAPCRLRGAPPLAAAFVGPGPASRGLRRCRWHARRLVPRKQLTGCATVLRRPWSPTDQHGSRSTPLSVQHAAVPPTRLLL